MTRYEQFRIYTISHVAQNLIAVDYSNTCEFACYMILRQV